LVDGGSRRVLRKARTAATLPGRLVAAEDRCTALEVHVGARLDEMRSELAEMRSMLVSVADGQADLAALFGRLLQASEARLEAIENESRPRAAESVPS
jgi:ABC-type phosphonate transport system ATPase subunit